MSVNPQLHLSKTKLILLSKIPVYYLKLYFSSNNISVYYVVQVRGIRLSVLALFFSSTWLLDIKNSATWVFTSLS